MALKRFTLVWSLVVFLLWSGFAAIAGEDCSDHAILCWSAGDIMVLLAPVALAVWLVGVALAAFVSVTLGHVGPRRSAIVGALLILGGATVQLCALFYESPQEAFLHTGWTNDAWVLFPYAALLLAAVLIGIGGSSGVVLVLATCSAGLTTCFWMIEALFDPSVAWVGVGRDTWIALATSLVPLTGCWLAIAAYRRRRRFDDAQELGST